MGLVVTVLITGARCELVKLPKVLILWEAFPVDPVNKNVSDFNVCALLPLFPKANNEVDAVVVIVAAEGPFGTVLAILSKDIVVVSTVVVPVLCSLLFASVVTVDNGAFGGVETNVTLLLPGVKFELDETFSATFEPCNVLPRFVSFFVCIAPEVTGMDRGFDVLPLTFPNRLVGLVADAAGAETLLLGETTPNVNVPGDEVCDTVSRVDFPKLLFVAIAFELVTFVLESGGTDTPLDIAGNVIIPDVVVAKSDLNVEKLSVFVSESIVARTVEFDNVSLTGKLKATCFEDFE